MPMNISSGKSSLLMPTWYKTVRSPPSSIIGESGKFASIAPEAIGSRSRGS